MDYQNALRQIHFWIEQQSVTFEGNRTRQFRTLQTLSQQDLEDFMDQHHCKLPAGYQQFLLEVGICELFLHPTRKSGLQFLPLDQLKPYSIQASDAFTTTFPQFMIIGVLSHVAGYVVLDLAREETPLNVFTADIDVEDWRAQPDDWCQFNEWIIQVVQTDGRKMFTYGLR